MRKKQSEVRNRRPARRRKKRAWKILLLLLLLLIPYPFYRFVYPQLGEAGRALRFEQAADESLSRGETAAAVQLLRQAISIEDNSERRYKLVHLLLADGHYDEAQSSFSRLEKRDTEEYRSLEKQLAFHHALLEKNDALLLQLLGEEQARPQILSKLDGETYAQLLRHLQARLYPEQSAAVSAEIKNMDFGILRTVLDEALLRFPEETNYFLLRVDLALAQKDADFLKKQDARMTVALESSEKRAAECFQLMREKGETELALKWAEQLFKDDKMNPEAAELLYEAKKNKARSDADSLLNYAFDRGFFGADKVRDRLGNSNGNLNNQGFFAEDEKNEFFTQFNNRHLHRRDKDHKNEIELAARVAEGITLWKDQVFFISADRDRHLFRVAKNAEKAGSEVEVYNAPVKAYQLVDGIIYLINADDHHIYSFDTVKGAVSLKKISDCRANEISSDGLRLYFTDMDRDNAISALPFAGGEVTVVNNDTASSVTPVGAYIYYINLNSNSSIYVIRRNGQDEHALPLPGNVKRLNVEEDKPAGAERIYFITQGIEVSDSTAGQVEKLSTAAASDLVLSSKAVIFRNDDREWVLSSIDKESHAESDFDAD